MKLSQHYSPHLKIFSKNENIYLRCITNLLQQAPARTLSHHWSFTGSSEVYEVGFLNYLSRFRPQHLWFKNSYRIGNTVFCLLFKLCFWNCLLIAAFAILQWSFHGLSLKGYQRFNRNNLPSHEKRALNRPPPLLSLISPTQPAFASGSRPT